MEEMGRILADKEYWSWHDGKPARSEGGGWEHGGLEGERQMA